MPKKTLDRLREVGTKNSKGRGVSKSKFGEKSGKKLNDPMREINQVIWNTSQPIVLLKIS